MDSRKLALLCRELADNKKAEDIAILNVAELSSVTDYFVIASCSSEPHLRAIVDEITDKYDHEVPSMAIGERVMEGLRDTDEVAYVRFASVYRRFQEATDFVQAVRKLEEQT